MYKIWNSIIDLIFPIECVVCGCESLNKKIICGDCFKDTMLIKSIPYCIHCGIKTNKENICYTCSTKEQYFSDSDSVFIYENVITKLINMFKFYDNTYLAKHFADYISDNCKELLSDVDIIIPVPIHFTRLFIRKYNQAALIAKFLEDKLNICVEYSLLKKVKITKSQSCLQASERKENLKNAFIVNVNDAKKIKNKVLCIIDDVVTTGTTLMECSKLLSIYSPKEIRVLSLARAIKS